MCKKIKRDDISDVMINQTCRSGTSISANIAEANETAHWLLLLRRTDFIKQGDYEKLNNQCQALIKMLYCSIRTVSYNLK
ncbi:four helix bundle protein [Lacrimispora sp. BS-2]|uniref:Four helix bundle protein n=1 Tax=Lacrimispora sp. BS-2 TaxID=3151850 RepID=A0AAU7PRU0_9FIRM